ncbi:MAG: hypothetical protein LQ348_003108 [Seirophora lacunosa]|nr:MAG: hypothetical protein LQ348_003108 [Seirophora lacunosa]
MHVGIVGGGISGLYSALVLRREGHHVTIFESNNRIGGRIYTHHFDPNSSRKGGSGKDGSQRGTPEKATKYFEAGAMRIPRSSLHHQVYDLIRYLNSKSAPGDKVELIPYILEHPNNVTFVQDRKTNVGDTTWGKEFCLPPLFHGKSARTLLLEVVRPWLELLRKDFDTGFREVLRYDELSFRMYLRAVVGWPHEVCEFVELMASQTNQYDLRWVDCPSMQSVASDASVGSFTEIIMQNLDFDTKEWVTVRGEWHGTLESRMLTGA